MITQAISHPLTREEFDQMIAPRQKDFPEGCRKFVEQMILPGSSPELSQWILADMSAAPPAVALSAMTEMMEQYITRQAAAVFEEIHCPVVTVNGDLWPVNYVANRRHMDFFDAIVLKGADHFLMMNRPEEFNRSLEKAIRKILENRIK